MNTNLLGNKDWEQCHFSPFSSRLKCLCLLQNCKPFAKGLLYSISPQCWCKGSPGWLVQMISDRHHTLVWLCMLTSFTRVSSSISANAHHFIKVNCCRTSIFIPSTQGSAQGWQWDSAHTGGSMAGDHGRVSEMWHHGKHWWAAVGREDLVPSREACTNFCCHRPTARPRGHSCKVMPECYHHHHHHHSLDFWQWPEPLTYLFL